MVGRITPYIGIGVGVVILGLALACWWQGRTIDGLRIGLEEKVEVIASMETAAKARDTVITEMRRDIAARDAALSERVKMAKEIETQRQAAQATLKETARNDPHTDSWAAVPLPAAVRGLLR